VEERKEEFFVKLNGRCAMTHGEIRNLTEMEPFGFDAATYAKY
jgi:hypothetical protein